MRNFRSGSAMTKIQAILCVALIASSIGIITFSLKALIPESAQFSLNVITRPASFGDALYAVPNQKCLFLVTIEENQTSSGLKAVNVLVASPNCVVTVFPQAIVSGQVAEVTVVPADADVGKNVTVTIQGERDGSKQVKTVTFEVIEEEGREETLGPEATSVRNNFAQWLLTSHPELGITNETAWTGTVVNPRILVVMHYMFLSEDWEMYVTWHVMIPPYDWARIYLRHRFNATAPSYAFEISSVQEQTEPQAIDVPDWV